MKNLKIFSSSNNSLSLKMLTDELSVFDLSIHGIASYLNEIDRSNFAYKNYLFECVLHVGQLCKKNIHPINKKAHKIINHFISDILSGLCQLFFVSGDLQKAESYCRKHLSWLDVIENTNSQDMAKRRFLGKLVLANIYFKLGSPGVILTLCSELQKISKAFYYNEFDEFIISFSKLCKEIAVHYYNLEKNISLQVALEFLLLFDTVWKKSNLQFEISDQFKKDTKFLEVVFSQITEDYEKEYISIINKFNLDGKNLVNLTFNRKEAVLFISPVDTSNFHNLKKIFSAHRILFETVANQLKIKETDCPPGLFQKIYQKYSQKILNKISQSNLPPFSRTPFSKNHAAISN